MNDKILYNRYKNRNFNEITILIGAVLVFVTLFTCILSLKAFGRSDGCELFLFLPISFGYLLVISRWRFLQFPINIGAVIVVGIEFVKLVLVPMFYVLSDYPKTIVYNAEYNDYYGIILQAYEAIWIGVSLNQGFRYKKNKLDVAQCDDKKSNGRMRYLVVLLLAATCFICVVAPEILANYRSILDASDSQYTNIEQSYIVDKYATSTIKKLFLVLANYWLKPMRLLFPAVAMILLRKHKSKLCKMISMILAVSPMLIIDGTVARSLYFTLVLLLLYFHLYKINNKKMILLFLAAAIFIFVYWLVRFYAVERDYTVFTYFAEKLNDYFCGFNIVGATLNLPSELEYHVKYFAYDFIRTIPFCNTIFGLESTDTVRNFFNAFSHTTGGQIASTLGMGSYYLTPLFAPLYSYIFSKKAISYSALAEDIENPYYKLVYSFIALYFALGIGINDISTTLSNLVQVALPIYIVVRLAYPRAQKEERNRA